MIRLSDYTMDELPVYIKKNELKIAVYGAGMIGKIIIPDYIMRKGLVENIDFYVDMDTAKQGRHISVGNKTCRICGVDALRNMSDRHILLITNSNFNPVLTMLDGMKELDDIEAVIIPVTLAMETEKKKGKYNITPYSPELIPKVIHYCWFSGKDMPDYLKKCMESWSRFCPDYEIRRWDESNYDVNKNLYMKQAYEEKKWGFVPDFARLDILYTHGGFYLDTDVELIKPLDELRTQMAFCGVEKWGNINMGGCSGALPHHPMIGKILEYRRNIRFKYDDTSLNLDTCGVYESKPFIDDGFRADNTVQRLNDMTVFSSDFFHPYDYMSGKTTVTDNTFSIHHFNGGWLDESSRSNREATLKIYNNTIDRIRGI